MLKCTQWVFIEKIFLDTKFVVVCNATKLFAEWKSVHLFTSDVIIKVYCRATNKLATLQTRPKLGPHTMERGDTMGDTADRGGQGVRTTAAMITMTMTEIADRMETTTPTTEMATMTGIQDMAPATLTVATWMSTTMMRQTTTVLCPMTDHGEPGLCIEPEVCLKETS